MAPDPTTVDGVVLVVCTGNVCRSPYVERLLTHALRDTAVVVRSAGTGALVGAPVDPGSAVRLEAAGAEPGGFAARQLEPRDVAEADLVLAATRQHLSSVVPLHPAALRYGFALRDLADLLSAVEFTEIDRGPGATGSPGSLRPRSAPVAGSRHGRRRTRASSTRSAAVRTSSTRWRARSGSPCPCSSARSAEPDPARPPPTGQPAAPTFCLRAERLRSRPSPSTVGRYSYR